MYKRKNNLDLFIKLLSKNKLKLKTKKTGFDSCHHYKTCAFYWSLAKVEGRY
jgi:hypothetical protein